MTLTILATRTPLAQANIRSPEGVPVAPLLRVWGLVWTQVRTIPLEIFRISFQRRFSETLVTSTLAAV